MKTCTKGKGCGASCIQKSDKCRAPLGAQPSKSTKALVFNLSDLLESGTAAKRRETAELMNLLGFKAETRKSYLNDGTKKAHRVVMQEAALELDYLKGRADSLIAAGRVAQAAAVQDKIDKIEKVLAGRDEGMIFGREFDDEFQPDKKVGSKYDWGKSLTAGSKTLGEGSFGTVIAPKPPPDEVVKRGEISYEEIDNLEKLKKLDIAPKLIAAETGKWASSEFNLTFYEGRVAMTRLPGQPYESASWEYKLPPTVLDNFWEARKKLHTAGIAHNDCHRENVLFDEKGKARFVDFGLSQDNPKAALSEALGIFASRQFLPTGAVTPRPLQDSGDFQGKQFVAFNENSAAYGKLKTNLRDVYSALRRKGFSADEIADIVTTGIRNPLGTYEKGSWGKLTNDDAKLLIDTLYKGI